MRWLSPVLLAAAVAILPAIQNVRAQSSIADITPCGLQCLVPNVLAAGCLLTDIKCQCASQRITATTAACMLANCTMADTLTLAKITASQCHLPHPDKRNQPITVSLTTLLVTSVFVVLRLVSKGVINHSFGWDDYLVGTALGLSVISTVTTVLMAMEGFGRHIWDLQPGALKAILRNFYIGESIYVPTLGLTKLSLLAFYLRVFPHPYFRLATYATIGIIVTTTSTITLLTIFQCHPVPYFWDKDLKGAPGKRAGCVDLNALAYANAGVSIVSDLIIIGLPVPVLAGLRLGWKKKAGVMGMFAVGSFGCLTSMIRLKSLLVFGTSVDPTWDYVPAHTWTALELGAGLICACLPAIRNLFARLWPKTWGGTSRTGGAAGGGQGGSGNSGSVATIGSGGSVWKRKKGLGAGAAGGGGSGGARGGVGRDSFVELTNRESGSGERLPIQGVESREESPSPSLARAPMPVAKLGSGGLPRSALGDEEAGNTALNPTPALPPATQAGITLGGVVKTSRISQHSETRPPEFDFAGKSFSGGKRSGSASQHGKGEGSSGGLSTRQGAASPFGGSAFVEAGPGKKGGGGGGVTVPGKAYVQPHYTEAWK